VFNEEEGNKQPEGAFIAGTLLKLRLTLACNAHAKIVNFGARKGKPLTVIMYCIVPLFPGKDRGKNGTKGTSDKY